MGISVVLDATCNSRLARHSHLARQAIALGSIGGVTAACIRAADVGLVSHPQRPLPPRSGRRTLDRCPCNQEGACCLDVTALETEAPFQRRVEARLKSETLRRHLHDLKGFGRCLRSIVAYTMRFHRSVCVGGPSSVRRRTYCTRTCIRSAFSMRLSSTLRTEGRHEHDCE